MHQFTKPPRLKEMLEISQSLAEPFSFIEIDLYSVKNKIKVGELECLPYCGHMHLVDQHASRVLGRLFEEPDFELKANLFEL